MIWCSFLRHFTIPLSCPLCAAVMRYRLAGFCHVSYRTCCTVSPTPQPIKVLLNFPLYCLCTNKFFWDTPKIAKMAMFTFCSCRLIAHRSSLSGFGCFWSQSHTANARPPSQVNLARFHGLFHAMNRTWTNLFVYKRILGVIATLIYIPASAQPHQHQKKNEKKFHSTTIISVSGSSARWDTMKHYEK